MTTLLGILAGWLIVCFPIACVVGCILRANRRALPTVDRDRCRGASPRNDNRPSLPAPTPLGQGRATTWTTPQLYRAANTHHSQ